jgi:hypothetical protein
LANLYKGQNDLTRWQQTLDEYLQTDSFGLGHTDVEITLARHFMARKEWDKAVPYADSAAESWAARAFICAIECHEGRRDWTAAEALVRQLANRYESAQTDWFFWCVRTGRGSPVEAWKLAAKRIELLLGTSNSRYHGEAACFYFLSQKSEEAFQILQQWMLRYPGHPYCGLLLAVMNDEEEKAQERDALLQKIAERTKRLAARPATAPKPALSAAQAQALAVQESRDKAFARLAELFAQWLAAPAPGDAERKQLAQAVQDVPAAYRVLAQYLVGRFLELHGDVEGGHRYLRTAARANYNATHLPGSALASFRLRAQGIDPWNE